MEDLFGGQAFAKGPGHNAMLLTHNMYDHTHNNPVWAAVLRSYDDPGSDSDSDQEEPNDHHDFDPTDYDGHNGSRSPDEAALVSDCSDCEWGVWPNACFCTVHFRVASLSFDGWRIGNKSFGQQSMNNNDNVK